MKLIVQLQLRPDEEIISALLDTLGECNRAANRACEIGFEEKIWNKFALQKEAYHQIREEFPLMGAQSTILACRKAAAQFEREKKKHRFRALGSFPFDVRTLSWNVDKQTVSIWTVDGRKKGIPFVCGEYQKELLQFSIGETDLIYRDKKFFLHAVVDFPDTEEIDINDYLGVDLGIVNIAVDSDGDEFSGSHMTAIRERANRLRKKLQAKRTRSAKRLLRKRRRKEHNFAKWHNHNIAKRIVEKAKRTGRGIALEELTHIRRRIRARKSQRRRLHSWSFAMLQEYIVYKAKKAGVPVVFVDPRHTSQQCPKCGHTEKANRKTRDNFSCVECGHAGPADTIGAVNIAVRALVIRPCKSASVTPVLCQV